MSRAARRWLVLGVAWWCLLPALAQEPYVPVEWTKFVPVEGQALPVPEQWLDTEEARIAHGLKLPDIVPKPVPFDFAAAGADSVFTSKKKAAVRYFDHLCSTEAGEWIVKTVKDVEGLYFARPQGPPSSDLIADPYGPEIPWIQRVFLLQGDSLRRSARWLIQLPNYNYRFVEQPTRDVKWQAGIREPYIRLFGYTREPALDHNGKPTIYFKDKTPMQVVGVAQVSARYGYTWRGIRRERDREHSIAGGELLIYDRGTREVLAVQRQFLIASSVRRTRENAAWEIAARCPQLRGSAGGPEFSQFAFDVLQTVEPSRTGR